MDHARLQGGEGTACHAAHGLRDRSMPGDSAWDTSCFPRGAAPLVHMARVGKEPSVEHEAALLRQGISRPEQAPVAHGTSGRPARRGRVRAVVRICDTLLSSVCAPPTTEVKGGLFCVQRPTRASSNEIPRSPFGFMHKLFHERERWSRRYINCKIFTGDMNTTQRSESINAVFAEKVKRASTLCDLFKALNEHSNHLMQQYLDCCKGREATAVTSRHPLEESICSLRLPTWTHSRLVRELHRSDMYLINTMGGEWELYDGKDGQPRRSRVYKVVRHDIADKNDATQVSASEFDWDPEDAHVLTIPAQTPVDIDDLPEWLHEEAGPVWCGSSDFMENDSLDGAVDGVTGNDKVAGDGARKVAGDGPEESDDGWDSWAWPKAAKVHRLVTMVEVKGDDGAWAVESVTCDCYSDKARGRHCAHVFRCLKQVNAKEYSVAWVHPAFRRGDLDAGEERYRAANHESQVVVTKRPEHEQQQESALVLERHQQVCKQYGQCLLEVCYRGTKGALDPVAIRRVQAAEELWGDIQTSNGDVLVKLLTVLQKQREVLQAEREAVSAASSSGVQVASATETGQNWQIFGTPATGDLSLRVRPQGSNGSSASQAHHGRRRPCVRPARLAEGPRVVAGLRRGLSTASHRWRRGRKSPEGAGRAQVLVLWVMVGGAVGR